MPAWLDELALLAARGEDAVLVTVADTRGSAPRETGAKMVVTGTAARGSIGGGQLEYHATERAVRVLRDGGTARDIRRYALGANCGQCCGGVVELLFEPLPGASAPWLDALRACCDGHRPAVLLTATGRDGGKFVATTGEIPAGIPAGVAAAVDECFSGAPLARLVGDWLVEPVGCQDFPVAVFGAGHVGAAVVDILSRLDCSIRWIDGRRRLFPRNLPANVMAIESADPAREVAAMTPGTFYLVMTHSHPLDLDICARILARDDVHYCGLIGSLSKRRRFERLLRAQGLAASRLEGLVCPIGVAGIGGKQPAEIAVAAAAELLQVRERLAPPIRRQPRLEVTGR